MAFVFLVNRTSDELLLSFPAALLTAFDASLSTEVVNEEELVDPLRDCSGLFCE
jgi:hypothetical protein